MPTVGECYKHQLHKSSWSSRILRHQQAAIGRQELSPCPHKKADLSPSFQSPFQSEPLPTSTISKTSKWSPKNMSNPSLLPSQTAMAPPSSIMSPKMSHGKSPARITRSRASIHPSLNSSLKPSNDWES